MQLPIGAEENFAGVVDLITKEAIYFDGDNGENVRIEEFQLIWLMPLEELRATMLDEVCAFDDDVMEKFLEGEEPTEEEIHRCIRNGVNSLELTPVFMGSALKTKVFNHF
jgi:elongation factor G